MLINPLNGICGQHNTSSADIHNMIKLLKAKGWYSGDRTYPIEHPTLLINARTAFHLADDKWDENCPYCQRRIQIFKELGHDIQKATSE